MLRATTPNAEAAVSLRLAHCAPAGWCEKRLRCARADRRLCDPEEQRIDGTAIRWPLGSGCPLFINARSAALETA